MMKGRKGKGTLHIIGGLLVASAVLRLGVGGTQVEAENAIEAPAAVETAPKIVQEGVDIEAMLAAFRDREERLELREQQVSDRILALEFADAQVSEKLIALTEAEEALRATIALAETAAELDLARLATVYENMKPKDAAALFTEMTPEFAAGFLGLMQPEAAAAIMTELEAPVAYSISVMLAGRNALVPTE